MGVAAVEGLQGPGRLERLAEGKVFATLKHMTGHGQPQGGNNVAPAPISERELRENFFPPFREVVRRTSVRSEEHTSELQSLLRTSYDVFCLKKKTTTQ